MPSFGDELRRERELRNITLREVEQATKISLRYLRALEENEFGELPGGVFNKGFVRAYCDYIGVDGESMVNAYLYEARTQASSARDEPHPFRRQSASVGDDPEPSIRTRGSGRLRWILVVLATLALAGIAGLTLWFTLGFSPGEADPDASRPPARQGGARRE